MTLERRGGLRLRAGRDHVAGGRRNIRTGNGGFTLVEVMVVLLIGIIVAAISIPTVAGVMRSSRLSGSTISLAAMVRSARSRAISTMEVHCLEIVETGPPGEKIIEARVYPEGASGDPDRQVSSARLETGIVCEADPAPELILEFQPDGSARYDGVSTPFSLWEVKLAHDSDPDHVTSVQVRGLTGAVATTARKKK